MLASNDRGRDFGEQRQIPELIRQHIAGQSPSIPTPTQQAGQLRDDNPAPPVSQTNDTTGLGQINGASSLSATVISRHQFSSSADNAGFHPQRLTSIRVRASPYRRTPCEGWCSCVCHRVQYLQTPERFQLAIGNLFVGLSGFPVWRRLCNERRCRQQTIPCVRVTYHFPAWFLARAIQLILSFTYMNGPQLSLRMPRTVEGSSDIFSFAVQGNLEGVKSLFRCGMASPFDVAATNGRTALHVRALARFRILDTSLN